MITMQDIEAMSTTQMVAWHNKHSKTQVKKFENRAAGIRRCAPIVEAMQAKAAAKSAKSKPQKNETSVLHTTAGKLGVAPEVLAQIAASESSKALNKPPADIVLKPTSGNALIITAPIGPDHEAVFEVATIPERLRKSSRSFGIAASWADPDVYAARTRRDGVMVSVDGAEGTAHKSTAAAFKAYGLPMTKHIRFRMRLKELGTATFFAGPIAYRFTIHNEGQK